VRENSTFASEGNVFTTLSVRVELNRHSRRVLASLLKTTARYSKEYRRRLVSVLKLGGLMSRENAEYAISHVEELPKVSLGRQSATLLLNVSDWLLGQGNAVDSLSPAILLVSPMKIPRGDRLTIDLDATEYPPIGAWPLPRRDDGSGHLLWTWYGGEVAKLGVHFEGQPEQDENHAFETASFFIAEALPFLLVLALLFWPPSDPGASKAKAQPKTGKPLLVWFGAAVLALSLGCFGYFVVEDWEISGKVGVILRVALPSAAIVAFVMLSFRWRRWRRWWQLLGLAPLVAGIALAFLVNDTALKHLSRSTKSVQSIRNEWEKASNLELIVGYVLVGVLLIAALGATARWVIRFLPRVFDTKRQIALYVFVVIAAVLLIVEIYLSSGAQGNWDSLVQGEPGPAVGRGYFLASAPLVVANLARILCATVLLFGLASWFWHRVGKGEIRFDSWKVCGLFAVFFATSVVGVSGRVPSWPSAFPLGFMIAVPAATVALKGIGESGQAKALEPTYTTTEANDFLKDSVRLSAIRHQFRTKQFETQPGETEQAAADRLGTQRDTLLDESNMEGGNRSREADMATVGLTGREGARKRWKKLGWVRWAVVAGPAAYSAYAVIHHQGEAAFSAESPAGLAYLIAALIAQASLWPLAAWAFVLVDPLLPGRIGPAKGLIAGLFCIAASGIASLAVDITSGPESWLFVPAEMTLMFVALGLALDVIAVDRIGFDRSALGDLYSVTSWRGTLAYLVPLGILLVGVIHALATGNAASSLAKLFLGAEAFAPPH
jgi:hypothetical protein